MEILTFREPTAILISIFLGLIVNECSDVSPWCARKLVGWSAHRRYPDPGRARERAEELQALIDARPDKLLKLVTALGFVGSAALVSCQRMLARHEMLSQGQPVAPSSDVISADPHAGLLAAATAGDQQA